MRYEIWVIVQQDNISDLRPTICTRTNNSSWIEGPTISPTETNFVLNKVFSPEALLCSGAENMKLWSGTVVSSVLCLIVNSHKPVVSSVPVKPQPQPNGQSVVASSVVCSGSVRTVQPCEPECWAEPRQGERERERERGHNQSVRSLLLPPPSVEPASTDQATSFLRP